MAMTREEVLHIAHLARIGLTHEDVERFRGQLSEILEHFQALSELDTEGVPPTAYPLPLENVMRDDETTLPLSREDVLANAPIAEDGALRVRAVLEE
jgi:aspartyl-tRNA(Asn)/glutamyl-tRNA(Gln) amidotransferase subunit C